MYRTMRHALVGLVFFLPLAHGAPVSESPATTEEVIAAVEATYAEVHSLRADFVQVSHSAALGQEERSKGKVSFKRPRMMRWDFSQPDNKLFVTNGETMWVWSPADNQVIITTDMGGSGMGVGELLDSLDSLQERFEVTLLEPEEGPDRRSYVLDLVPKNDASFKKLRIGLSKRKYHIERVTVTDAFDNEVKLSFSQVKFNADLSDASFVFQVPKDAEVIRADGL